MALEETVKWDTSVAVVQFIVGLARPLLPERIREFGEIVKDLGGQVGSYIPHSSYLVILDQRRVEDLEALACELS